jgi:dGTPase
MTMRWEQLLDSDRRRPTTNPAGARDEREEFERDFDRTIFSPPVRRLQDKAQVFPLDPNDFVRTRLTHSLEVSAVARGLARRISKWLLQIKEITGVETGRKIEAIAATCGLLHDLGNPPFGHSGEDAIRHWFKERLGQDRVLDLLKNDEKLAFDFLLFEGNAQTLRIVTKLQVLADEYGLNLTYGTLSAACKYLAPAYGIDKERHAFKKPGFFASERAVVEDIRERTGTGDARNPITFLVEAADDAVYAACDIEDAVKKEIVSAKHVKEELCDNDKEMAKAVIQRTDKILREKHVEDDAWATAFRTACVGLILEYAENQFHRVYDDIMNGSYFGELLSDSEGSQLLDTLKSIARKQAYTRPETLKLEVMGREVICDLMDFFWEAAEGLTRNDKDSTKTFHEKLRCLLSSNYKRVFRDSYESRECGENYHRLQLVVDYISGMTDSFARRLHKELKNG